MKLYTRKEREKNERGGEGGRERERGGVEREGGRERETERGEAKRCSLSERAKAERSPVKGEIPNSQLAQVSQLTI